MTYGLLQTNRSENGGDCVHSSNRVRGTNFAEEIDNAGQPNRRRPHAEILYEDFLEETRTAFANVVSIMNHRSDSVPDAFVRHHLVAMTREVAEIGRTLLAKSSARPDTQDLVDALDIEVANLNRSFPNRLRRTGDWGLPSKALVPWTILQVFRLLVHDLLKGILQNVSKTTELHARLQKTGSLLRLEISNINLGNEHRLLGRLKSRLQFRQRLDALGGHVVAGDQSISIIIPNAALLRHLYHNPLEKTSPNEAHSISSRCARHSTIQWRHK
jgi:hypothetical protein